MLYRIVILNGERRGERVDVPETRFTLGRAPACGLTLNDAALEPVHAELTQCGASLLIRSGNPGAVIRVNDVEVTESVLQHGDVVEIGTTRFFIQQSDTTTWKNLSRLRKKRTLITIVLPVMVAGIIMALVSHNRKQPGSEPAPASR
ncbi:MAG: FHA domain-containing protein, partial [bacterium]